MGRDMEEDAVDARGADAIGPVEAANNSIWAPHPNPSSISPNPWQHPYPFNPPAPTALFRLALPQAALCLPRVPCEAGFPTEMAITTLSKILLKELFGLNIHFFYPKIP